MTFRVLAPGKAVLIGEYAVLDGAPALSMAVNRYARLQLQSSSAGDSWVAAPQLRQQPFPFTVEPGGELRWQGELSTDSPFQATAYQIEQRCRQLHEHGASFSGFQLTIDTADLFLEHQGLRHKLGLGSSSAVSLGLQAILDAWAGIAPSSAEERLVQLLDGYRTVQGGQGSGIDLATSLYGGVIRFQRQADDMLVQRRHWPQGLHLRFVWTGQPASTPKLLARFRQWQSEQPAQSAALLARMSQCSKEADSAFQRNEVNALQAALAHYGALMGTMGDCMQVPILGGHHGRIRSQADQLGLAYKPSGAGVGDLGLIAGTDLASLEQMEAWLNEQGLPLIRLDADLEGVRIVS